MNPRGSAQAGRSAAGTADGVRRGRLTRLDFLDGILPYCEPDRACLQNREGRFCWLYSAKQVESAIAAWREGRLSSKSYETSTKDERHTFIFDNPVRLGLVPHRDGKVGVFQIDLDNHAGGRDTTVLLGRLQRFLGRPAILFRSKGGKGLHVTYRLAKPTPVGRFVKWSKGWGFNRQGRTELFPKTKKLTQMWLPNEPNVATHGDEYVSGNFEDATLEALPSAPPSGLPDGILDFLMGLTEPGNRNDVLNKTAFILGQRRCAPQEAEALCLRGTELCGLDRDEAERTFRSGFTAGRDTAPPVGKSAAGDGLASIVVNGRQLRDVVADAWVALHKANTGPSVFLRYGSMAHLATPKGEPTVAPMDVDLAYGQLTRCATWLRVNEEGEESHTKPSRDVARDMLAYPDPALPPLDAVVTAPVFGHAGGLVSQPGYHAEDALWLHLPDGFDLGEIPENPTQEETEAARSLLISELLGDFPFVSDSDLAHAVAAILLPFVRLMVDGCTPLHLVEAPTPGSGKGLLCKLISVIAAGEVCASRTLPQDENEVRKAITAQLSNGPTIIVLDNADDA